METLISKTESLEKVLKHYNFLEAGKYNPFNYVGKQHNECLNYLLTKGDTTASKLVKNAFTFIKQNDGGFIKEFDKAFEEKLVLLCDNMLNKFESKQEITLDCLNMFDINDATKSELYWLVDIILSFDVESNSFTSIIEKLNSWEYRIKNSCCNDTDRSTLLMASAIARHSTWYWTREQYLELEEATDTSLASRAKRKKKCLRTVFTVCADLIGGVAGAVAGGVVGGPVGGAVGAVVVSGAMSGGAYAIFR